MRKLILTIVAVLGAGLLLGPGSAHANLFEDIADRVFERHADRESGDERGGDRQRARVSLDDAVSMVRSRYGGRVIKARTRYEDGRPVHHVKLLGDNGRMRTVRVDGVSGRVR